MMQPHVSQLFCALRAKNVQKQQSLNEIIKKYFVRLIHENLQLIS